MVAGRRLENQPTGTSQRYGPAHCHPGQARTACTDPQLGGSARALQELLDHWVWCGLQVSE